MGFEVEFIEFCFIELEMDKEFIYEFGQEFILFNVEFDFENVILLFLIGNQVDIKGFFQFVFYKGLFEFFEINSDDNIDL